MRGAILGVLLLVAPLFAGHALADAPLERRLVSFHGEVPEDGARLLSDIRVLDAFPFARVALVEGPATSLSALSALPGVAGVYPEERLSFNLDRARAITHADAPEGARDGWPTGRNVTIALVDSGIDPDHPGFQGRLAASVKISRGGSVSPGQGDADGHGTHVAGIAGGDGAASDGRRLRGYAPEARLVGVDISDAFTTTSAVRAFSWIHEHRDEHNIRVVSNSWGREKEDAHYDENDPVIRASDALVADGIVVVFSAGNRGRDGESTLTTEATNPNVITVGAASANGRVESYSSRGPAKDADGKRLSWVKPDLAAPGTAIVSARTSAKAAPGATGEARYYTVMNGTSMAAPQVAGAAALLLDVAPDLEPAMVAAILTGTARDLATPGPDSQTGHGMMDVDAAIQATRALGEAGRRVVIETRLPVRQEGTLAAAESLILLQKGMPQVPPEQALDVPVSAPAGAAQADLWFNWSGPGSFEAFLVGPGGRVAFEPAGSSSLRVAAPITPGAWHVEARQTGAAAYSTYSVAGSLLIRQEKILDTPAEFHARHPTGTAAQGGFFLPQSGAARVLDVFTSLPGLVLGLAGVTCGGSMWWLRRRG